MFGINELKKKIDKLLSEPDMHSVKMDKIMFTLSELNDNINHLIDKIEDKKPEKPKKEKKK